MRSSVLVVFIATACDSTLDEFVLPVVGTWEGFVEAYTFDSGSDLVRFELDAFNDATGDVSGRVIFGQGTPLPPATDPNVGYPLGVEQFSTTRRIFEGFEYPLHDATLDGTRFRASFYSNIVWADWCSLQTPISFDQQGELFWYCVPNWLSMGTDPVTTCSQENPETGEIVAVDCGKLKLCLYSRVCECDAAGCAAELEDASSFDITFDGDRGDGTVTGVFGRRTVRLDRAP